MSLLAENIERRREDWLQLERMLSRISNGSIRSLSGREAITLSDLYRKACADLAMAEQYQLSPSMIEYLHTLVGRAHNTLYGSRTFQLDRWFDLAFRYVPRQIYRDTCIQVVALLFFGLFGLSTYMAYNQEQFPNFGEQIIGVEAVEQMERGFREPFGRNVTQDFMMAAYYIQNNTGIGFQCFALGPLILPGLFATVFNAIFLGATFGFMARPDVVAGGNFLQFVTAHGAFELTAIALSAGVGLRIGIYGWLFTGGLSRVASLQREGRRSIPIIAVAGVLFFLAALTEGFISPSTLPYLFKAMWLVMSSALLMFYFVVLGYPEPDSATGQD